MQHETKYLHHQGLKIAYDSEAGEKTLILLHGLTANKQNFDGLSRAGLAKNYRLIRPDLRGRGLSDIHGHGGALDHRAGFDTVRRNINRMIERYSDRIMLSSYYAQYEAPFSFKRRIYPLADNNVYVLPD